MNVIAMRMRVHRYATVFLDFGLSSIYSKNNIDNDIWSEIYK